MTTCWTPRVATEGVIYVCYLQFDALDQSPQPKDKPPQLTDKSPQLTDKSPQPDISAIEETTKSLSNSQVRHYR